MPALTQVGEMPCNAPPDFKSLNTCSLELTPEQSRSLPSFFVIGPPRTGSTWLYEALRAHALLPRPTKETRFFDTHFQRGFNWYRAHFPKRRSNQTIGEVAPTYFASAEARERIARSLPQSRVVCVFRDPVERILSLYRLKSAYGHIPWNFEEALDRDPELLESGKYASNLRAWQKALGPNQVLATLYDDLRDNPQAFLENVADFIGVTRFRLAPSQVRRVCSSESMTYPRSYFRTRHATMAAEWCKAWRLDVVVALVKRSPLMTFFLGGGQSFTDISPESTRRLYELFLPEIEALETLLNRDLSHWKSHRGVLPVR